MRRPRVCRELLKKGDPELIRCVSVRAIMDEDAVEIHELYLRVRTCMRGAYLSRLIKGLFGFILLKFNSHHINVPLNACSTKCRLIVCMSVQIRSNLRDESIKPN
jgi:hypothetical protein